MGYFAGSDDSSFDEVREFLSPAQVDHSVRQALQDVLDNAPQRKTHGWRIGQSIPSDRDRALKDMRR